MKKQRSFAFVLIISAFVVSVVCVGDANHDRPYFDLPGMPLTLAANQNENQCDELCTNNTKCVAWVFAPANCGDVGPNNLCWLKASLPKIIPFQCRISGTKDLTLLPSKFRTFPIGNIMPEGWLLDQLQIQAAGLTGHLSLFWASINQSAWIGVQNGDSFERVPYWLNGLVPLAYLLNDPALHDQMNRYLDYILANQIQDGWIGPTCCDPWPRFPLMLALLQYNEANPSDNRIIPAMTNFFIRLRSELDQNPLSSWAQYRWQDLVYAVHWMFDNYPQGQEQFLLDFAEEAFDQGFDWGGFFGGNEFPHTECTGSCISMQTHGVNVGQSLKFGPVWYRQSKNTSYLEDAYSSSDIVYKYHGMASGIFGCDEHLAGNMPSHGSELCTVVETMFSFEVNMAITGDPTFGDKVERLAFNALPATLTPDMWAHQYLQQPNEINSAHIDPYIWTSDGPDSNIYGLQPNFGCCTANFNQGFPKFTTRLFLRSQDNGIVAALYAPSTLTTEINGQPVVIALDTEYPFGSVLTFTIKTATDFPFYLRIPGWANGSTVVVGNGKPQSATPGEFFNVQVSTGQVVIVLNLPLRFYVDRRFNNAASIYYGPLLFALDLPPKWTQLAYYAFNSSDWQALPTGPWAYAINISDENPEQYLKLTTRNMGPEPFSGDGTPFVVYADGRLIDDWTTYDNAAQPPPMSPVSSSHPTQQLVLKPFGATKLRIAEIPTLN